MSWLDDPALPVIAAAYYGATSIATFCVFAWDKACAKRGQRRVPEATLHSLELFGGWPGALLAMRVLRHKSAKTSFRAVTWFNVMLHVAGWGVYAWWRMSKP
ncbi:MAG: DUF1294 domain-containing protein [Planctomycetota bacterium]